MPTHTRLPFLHRQNRSKLSVPAHGAQPVGVGRVRWYPNHNTPIEPDLVCGCDDRGGADAEDSEEHVGGGPPFKVGYRKGAFGGMRVVPVVVARVMVEEEEEMQTRMDA